MSKKLKVDADEEECPGTPTTRLLKHINAKPITRNALNKAKRTLSGLKSNLTPKTLKYYKRRSSASNLTPRTLINAVLVSHKTVQKETNLKKYEVVKQTPLKYVQTVPFLDETNSTNFSFRRTITDFLNEAEQEITTVVAKKKIRLSKTDDTAMIESDNDITTHEESYSTPLELDIGMKKRIDRDHYYTTTEDWTHAMNKLKDHTSKTKRNDRPIDLENIQKVKRYPLKSYGGADLLPNIVSAKNKDETLGNVPKVLNISESSYGNLMEPLLSNNKSSPKSMSESQKLIVNIEKNNVLSTIRKMRPQSITPISDDQVYDEPVKNKDNIKITADSHSILSAKTSSSHVSGSGIKISLQERIDDNRNSHYNIPEYVTQQQSTPNNRNFKKTSNIHDSDSKNKTNSSQERISASSFSQSSRTVRKSLQVQFEYLNFSDVSNHNISDVSNLNISENVLHQVTLHNHNSENIGQQHSTPKSRQLLHNTSEFVPQQHSTSANPNDISDIRSKQLTNVNQCSSLDTSGHVSQQHSSVDNQHSSHNITSIKKQQSNHLNTSGHVPQLCLIADSCHSPPNSSGIGKQQLTSDINHNSHFSQQHPNSDSPHNTSDISNHLLTFDNHCIPHNTSGLVSQQLHESQHSHHNTSNKQLPSNSNTSGHVLQQSLIPDSWHSHPNTSDIRKRQLTPDIRHPSSSSDKLQVQSFDNQLLMRSTAKSSKLIETHSPNKQSVEGNTAIKESISNNKKMTSKPDKTKILGQTKRFQALRNISKGRKPVLSEFFLKANDIKSIFSHYSNGFISKAAWKVIQLGSEQFFKNLLIDLSVLCHHANRFTIQTEDVLLLMHRQRFLNEKQTFSGLVEKNLPLEFREKLIPVARLNNELLK